MSHKTKPKPKPEPKKQTDNWQNPVWKVYKLNEAVYLNYHWFKIGWYRSQYD